LNNPGKPCRKNSEKTEGERTMEQLVYGKFKPKRCALIKNPLRRIRLAGILAALLLAACSTGYKIGDKGPAGGIVFYDRGQPGADGWRYLEAAPEDLPATVWGPPGEEIGGTDTGVGSGKRNTEIIVNALKNLNQTGTAAQLCDSFTLGEYADWFLPGKDELDLMYRNLKTKGLGGFSNDRYWSSSEYLSEYTWSQMFSDGIHVGSNKGSSFSVRAVRAF
jgi:hypothetical protein